MGFDPANYNALGFKYLQFVPRLFAASQNVLQNRCPASTYDRQQKPRIAANWAIQSEAKMVQCGPRFERRLRVESRRKVAVGMPNGKTNCNRNLLKHSFGAGLALGGTLG